MFLSTIGTVLCEHMKLKLSYLCKENTIYDVGKATDTIKISSEQRFGGGPIIYWGCLPCPGPGHIAVIVGYINRQVYQEVLLGKSKPFSINEWEWLPHRVKENHVNHCTSNAFHFFIPLFLRFTSINEKWRLGWFTVFAVFVFDP